MNVDDVKDLKVGDVVEVFDDENWPEGTICRGPLYLRAGELRCSGVVVRNTWGLPPRVAGNRRIVVLKRLAPLPEPKLPVYVNSDRTEYKHGDLVVGASGKFDGQIYEYAGPRDSELQWRSPNDGWFARDELPNTLRLVVDGETKRYVSE